MSAIKHVPVRFYCRCYMMMGLYRTESGIATIGWMKNDVWFRNITQKKDYSPRILQHVPTGLWASDLGFANAPSVSGLRGARLPLASGMWAPRSWCFFFFLVPLFFLIVVGCSGCSLSESIRIALIIAVPPPILSWSVNQFGGDAQPKPKHPNTLHWLYHVISGYQTYILQYTVIHFPERLPPRNYALVDESTGIRWRIAMKMVFFFPAFSQEIPHGCSKSP